MFKTERSSARARRLIVPGLVLLVGAAGCGDVIVAPEVDVDSRVEPLVTDSHQLEFAVDPGATVEVENFTGAVTYRPGEAGEVRVVLTRHAPRADELDLVVVQTSAGAGGVSIATANPENVARARVDLVITAPADALPRLFTAVGSVDYRGRPAGSCSFETGVGTVRLLLPADVGLVVELDAGVGEVSLGLPVDGTVSDGYVAGSIGRGDEGHLRASTAVGNIHLGRH